MDDTTKLAIGATAVIATTTATVGGIYLLGKMAYNRFFKKEEPKESVWVASPDGSIKDVPVEPNPEETPETKPEPAPFTVVRNDDDVEIEGLGEHE